MARGFFALACLTAVLLAGSTAVPVGAAPASSAPAAVPAQLGGSASIVDATIDDLQSWWADRMPEVYGTDYEPIPDDRLFPYSEDNPPPSCEGRGGGRTPYREVAGNAFYCSLGDFVAWDEQELFPRLERRFGGFAVALVLAHEWGHVVQARTDSSLGATIYLEVQADCFAGSWAQHVERDDVSLPIDGVDLDAALGGFLEFRDPPGVNPSQQGAHGNAFDRVSGFQDGFEDGVDQCAGYESNPPEVTETPFTSSQDAATGGDLPLADTIDLLRPDLDDYWERELDGSSPVRKLVADDDASCDGQSDGGVLVSGVQFCSANDVVAYDPEALEDVYDATGDFGAGMVLAAAWSSGAMQELGLPLTGDRSKTRADCLTGAWTGDVARGDRNLGDEQLALSPGDLDEGIATFVSLGGEERGSAFARVAAFRMGFLRGPDACTRT